MMYQNHTAVQWCETHERENCMGGCRHPGCSQNTSNKHLLQQTHGREERPAHQKITMPQVDHVQDGDYSKHVIRLGQGLLVVVHDSWF